MIFAVDFDGTVVEMDHDYDDLESPLTFIEGAEEGLRALKRAGHKLLLWSARSNRGLRIDPQLDPLVRAGVYKLKEEYWEKSQPLQAARYAQMLAFVEEFLPGIFDAVDDGQAGKPMVDMFIDDRAFHLDASAWGVLSEYYGAPEKEEEPDAA